jgi:outer membrane murein-binding lipoprotein Lpp
MDKILEALSKLLPEDQVKEISSAVNEILESYKVELEEEYNKNLEEAYAELSKEVNEAEKVGVEGYEQAWNTITELRNRAEMLRAEYNTALDEGYEEAYQEILAERGKNEQLELQLHEEYEGRYQEMRKFFVDKMHQFLETKGKEIYEMARRDIMNDPSMVEHKVVLDKVVETVGNYLTDEDRVLATGTRLEETGKKLDEMASRVRILEAKNIRLSNENTRLNEQVRDAAEMLTESKKTVIEESRKVRAEKSKNATGRGELVTGKNAKVIAEFAGDTPTNKKKNDNDDTTLVESMNPADLHAMQILAGTKVNS